MYVDAPELLDGIKSHHLFEKIVPIVALWLFSLVILENWGLVWYTRPLVGLVNQSVHSFIRGCLTVKFSGS